MRQDTSSIHVLPNLRPDELTLIGFNSLEIWLMAGNDILHFLSTRCHFRFFFLIESNILHALSFLSCDCSFFLSCILKSNCVLFSRLHCINLWTWVVSFRHVYYLLMEKKKLYKPFEFSNCKTGSFSFIILTYFCLISIS